jgi:hypothetical protein
MPAEVPDQKPRLSTAELQELLATVPCEPVDHPLLVVGVRGYYADKLGKPKKNDRNLYDDAIFVHTPFVTASYNANTDPSSYRKGQGTAEDTKGMASLKPGLWPVYRFGLHGKSKYFALCQTGGKVTVVRDGEPDYEDTGYFGINIHRGGYNTTSSLGCQTIHPTQWDSFISLVKDQAQRLRGADWKGASVTYALVERSFL